MVTGLFGSSIGEKIGVDERIIIATVRQSDSALVNQGSVGDGIERKKRFSSGSSGFSTVVGPFSTTTAGRVIQNTDVLSGKEEGNDGVRETNVEGRLGGDIFEGSILSRLDLVNEHITRSITHLDTFVIVNNSVVSTGLRILERRLLASGSLNVDVVDGSNATTDGAGGGKTGVDDNEIFPSAESVVDLDIVERESGNGESKT